MALYRPNYTKTDGTVILHTETLPQTKSMSVWCSACHTAYNQPNAATAVTYNYDPYLPGLGAAPQVGSKAYHRHAVDQNMARRHRCWSCAARGSRAGLRVGPARESGQRRRLV